MVRAIIIGVHFQYCREAKRYWSTYKEAQTFDDIFVAGDVRTEYYEVNLDILSDNIQKIGQMSVPCCIHHQYLPSTEKVGCS